MEQRIKTPKWKLAVRNRYLDLRMSLRSDVVNMGLQIEPDNKQLRVMKLLKAIAKIEGISVKE